MARWQEEPKTGNSVWHPEWKNGKITHIDYEYRVVYCDFYDNGLHTIDLDEFFGCLNERVNQWQIAP